LPKISVDLGGHLLYLSNHYFLHTMKYYAWTTFKGSESEAKEFANEWNEITGEKSFDVTCSSYLPSRGYSINTISGYVTAEIVKETNIENEFVVDEFKSIKHD